MRRAAVSVGIAAAALRAMARPVERLAHRFPLLEHLELLHDPFDVPLAFRRRRGRPDQSDAPLRTLPSLVRPLHVDAQSVPLLQLFDLRTLATNHHADEAVLVRDVHDQRLRSVVIT